MDLFPELTAGCLESIIKEKKHQNISSPDPKPMVQILSSKLMSSGSIRCVLFDGINTSKQGVLKFSEQITAYYNSKQLDSFSVIRLDQYWMSSTFGPNDIELIIISNVTPIMKGSQITKKLEVFPECDEPMDESFNPFGHSFISGDNEPPIVTTFNPNYKPRHKRNIPSPMVPIDRSKRCLIKDIHPFFNSFVIRCKIAAKTPLKKYVSKTDGRDGKLFSFDVTDESSEIRVTAFNTECDKFYDIIEKDLVYYIFKGSVKPVNRKFCNLKNEFEITLNSESTIELCDEDVELPSLPFKLIGIDELLTLNNGTLVDVIGIITIIDDLQSVLSKKEPKKEINKREVVLIDKSLHEVRLTLWGEFGEKFSGTIGQVLAIKNALIGEFRGKTIGSVQSSVIELDPDLPEAHLLKGWYDKEIKCGPLRDVIRLCKVRDESHRNIYLSQINVNTIPEESMVYHNCKVTILTTNRVDRLLYKACVDKTCNKKVREENNFYFCEKCGNNSPKFEWRLMLSLCCADATAHIWITAFQEVAEKLIGKSTDQLSDLIESDPNECQTLISGLHFKSFNLRIGSQIETYNNEKRVKSVCHGITPIDAIERSNKLIRNIKSWTQ